MSIYRHHRGSIFWALTLIAIGAIFLYQNFNPIVRPWHLIAKYWPVLIIFWGLSKLIDYFHARNHPEAQPHSLLSAGEIVLLIVVLIIGTALSKALLRPWGGWPSVMGMNDQQFAEIFFNSYTFTQRVSQDVEGSAHLLVVNRRGNVEIRGADQKSIGAVIQETVWAENESAARKIADRLQFQIAQNGGQYELTSNLDSILSSGRTVRLDMAIRVPQSTTSDVAVDDGDVTVRGLKGNQTLTSRRGDVQANDIDGILRIHESRGTTSASKIDGSVEIEGRGEDVGVRDVTGSVTVEGNFSGATRFEAVARTLRYNSSRTNLMTQNLTGNLTMDMSNLTANGVGGPFELSTRDKDILLENFKFNVKIVNSNGAVHLQTTTPPTHPIDVDLKKGDITLSLPVSSNFQVDAVSHNGGVSCDFPGLKVSKEPPMPAIEGTYGSNGPMIRLSSTYGDIHLLRLQTPPPPAAPSTASLTENRPRREGAPGCTIRLAAR
ncbi:MAG: hypothetical protein EPN47_06180 [Acidobacteria bacterium]|nr:MAG: hypothetical protein EPN47_06180 [Acidobacteriota bacterium]